MLGRSPARAYLHLPRGLEARYSPKEVTAEEVIRLLKLEPHTGEGGYFRRTYESKEKAGNRFCGTAIYYLVTPNDFSAIHRLPQEELFHFYLGDAVEMVQINPDGNAHLLSIGTDLLNGERPQVLVPANVWQGTRLKAGGAWALLGCTVVPGFEYSSYEIGQRENLFSLFPKHRDLISQFTR